MKPESAFDPRFLEIEHGRIHYVDEGSGEPVLFVHGTPSWSFEFPHLIRAELSWETATGWYMGPTCEWVPEKTYIDFRNTYAADAYVIAGVRIGRRTPQGFSWFAEARNVFDKKYAATTGVIENAAGADQAQFLPGEGRGFFGGLEYRC